MRWSSMTCCPITTHRDINNNTPKTFCINTYFYSWFHGPGPFNFRMGPLFHYFLGWTFADCPPLSQTDHKALADMTQSALNLADGLSTHKSHSLLQRHDGWYVYWQYQQGSRRSLWRLRTGPHSSWHFSIRYSLGARYNAGLLMWTTSIMQ